MTGTVQSMTTSQIKDLAATLIGAIPDLTKKEAQKLIGSKGVIVEEVRGVLTKFVLPKPVGVGSTWHTLTLGVYTQEEILTLLSTRKYQSKIWAKTMIKNQSFFLAKEERQVELSLVSPVDLGFSQEPTTAELCDRARGKGLRLCPPEVGPVLWLNLKNYMGSIIIGMKPISDGSTLSTFRLSFFPGNNSAHWIQSEPFDRTVLKRWPLDSLFVFLK